MITQEDLQGHWQRDWIKAPGFEDHTTQVHWLQAGALFADLRIPLARPDLTGVSCLADMTPAALRVLMEAEGFAGHLTVEDSTCTWYREINWHGVPGQADTGLMSFDDKGGLIEDGVLAEYRELWQAVPQPALRGARVRCGESAGVLIENDAAFLLGMGPVPEGSTEDLIGALDEDRVDTQALQRHFDGAYVLGRWDGPLGVAVLSTNPFYEGKVALERGTNFVWHAVSFDGESSEKPLVLQ